MRTNIRFFLLAAIMMIAFVGWSQEAAQTQLVNLGTGRRIKIAAYQPINDWPQLVFTDGRTGKILTKVVPDRSEEGFKIVDPESLLSPKIHFRVLHIKNLPDPLILAVTATYGATDCFYDALPIALVNGKIQRLIKKTVDFDIQGGFSLGSLGRGRGVGLAVSSFEWGADESHYQPHHYRVRLLQWRPDLGRLVPVGFHRSRKEASGKDAAIDFGLPADEFIDFERLISWFPDFGC